MEQFTFTILYPTDKKDEFLSALRNHFGEDLSPSELKDKLENQVREELKTIYRKWKKSQLSIQDLELS